MFEHKKINHNNRKHSILDSFNYAIEGIINAIIIERHMKIHVIVTIFVVIISLFLKLDIISLAILGITIGIVWITELINTAIEGFADIIEPKYHPQVKFIKDVASGAVFVSAVLATFIGYLIFIGHLRKSSMQIFKFLKSSYAHTLAVIFVIVSILVIALKSYYKSGSPLEGGKPSGHSALAFSAWAAILFISNNIVIVALGFFIAVLVAQSRIKNGIHNFSEVFFGAALGGSVTYLILLLLKLF
ncbi:diacylglycerol kinase (ATP) [Hypnocyclicus thermotrophus]|uniref:Diacylglycerol kinase (ATP) n=1 Tax=Hypnocyclicus thermotrophus TaxID=1627895 RepID=A0AA46I5Y7_9FUSO|nr:diacylglycerol kinase [Hypnocyclicus thermotrophus]TDT71862.1 diacylglycerol kinase (ATP) [Hypnocyclicus thermotrophus]